MFKVRSKRRMVLEPFKMRTLNVSDWGLNSEDTKDVIQKKKRNYKRKSKIPERQNLDAIIRNKAKESSMLRKDVRKMSPIIAEWLIHWLARRRLYYFITLVFTNFGTVFQKRRQNKRMIFKKCRAYIRVLKYTGLPILCLLDKNASAFNGCKTKKMRRKKRRYYLKKSVYVKYKKN